MKTSQNIRSTIALLLLLRLTAAALPASASENPVSDQEFLTFNLAHPEKDAARDISLGKPHCFSVKGYAKSFPGAENPADISLCNSLERNISGTSDYHTSDHADVQRAAISYATAYNRYILAHIRDVK